jgi:predicted glutamine amidotransferase
MEEIVHAFVFQKHNGQLQGFRDRFEEVQYTHSYHGTSHLMLQYNRKFSHKTKKCFSRWDHGQLFTAVQENVPQYTL